MPQKLKTISIRLPESVIEELNTLAEREVIDRGTLVRKITIEGLQLYKIDKALEMYRLGKISLWKAATSAGITYREALEELKRRGITFRYAMEDLESDIKWALRK